MKSLLVAWILLVSFLLLVPAAASAQSSIQAWYGIRQVPCCLA
jgi:hypothetical protein